MDWLHNKHADLLRLKLTVEALNWSLEEVKHCFVYIDKGVPESKINPVLRVADKQGLCRMNCYCR